MNNQEIITQHPNATKNLFLSNHYTKNTSSPLNYQLFKTKKQCLQQNTSQYLINNHQNIEKQTVLMPTTELKQFTRKCAQQRIYYQTQIQQLTNQLITKSQQISYLQHNIKQLKQQQQYLISTIQHLRDNHFNIIPSQLKITKIIKIKDDQIQYLNKQIHKFKSWLKQQQIQIFRCIQCIKLKDSIIENLQFQNQQFKSFIQSIKYQQNNHNVNFYSKFCGNNHQCNQLEKQKCKSKQLQKQLFQLVSQIDHLRSNSSLIKHQLTNNPSKPNEPQPYFHPHSNPSQKPPINSENPPKTLPYEKYQILNSKTYYLQTQLQKLMTQVLQLKQNLYSKPYDGKRQFSMKNRKSNGNCFNK